MRIEWRVVVKLCLFYYFAGLQYKLGLMSYYLPLKGLHYDERRKS